MIESLNKAKPGMLVRAAVCSELLRCHISVVQRLKRCHLCRPIFEAGGPTPGFGSSRKVSTWLYYIDSPCGDGDRQGNVVMLESVGAALTERVLG